MQTKRCSGCGEVKTASEFYVRRASSDGIGALCKPCAKEHARKWRKNNPEKHLAYRQRLRREWRERCERTLQGRLAE